MRYYVTLDPDPNAKPVLVDLVELPSGALQAHLDGRPVEVDVTPLDRQLSIRVDGRVVDLTTEGAPPDLGAVASGHRSYVRVESERMRSAEQAKKSTVSGGEKTVKSPMPGRVVKVLVAKGDAVAVGQGLVVLEAMKMETPLASPYDAVVRAVHVAEGDRVAGGTLLVELGE